MTKKRPTFWSTLDPKQNLRGNAAARVQSLMKPLTMLAKEGIRRIETNYLEAEFQFDNHDRTSYRLFVTQCLYRVHVRGLPGWIDSEYNPHAEGNDQ